MMRGKGSYAHLVQPTARIVGAPHKVLHVRQEQPAAGLSSARAQQMQAAETPRAAGAPSERAAPAATPRGSFLDDTLPRRGPPRQPLTESIDPFPAAQTPRVSNGNARDLQAAVHRNDGVAANVFNNVAPAAGKPTTPRLKDHPLYQGAKGRASDNPLAQAHPGLPGYNGVPGFIPGTEASLSIGRQAEELIARRQELLTPRRAARGDAAPADPDPYVPNVKGVPATKFPWEMAADVAPTQPAPPKEYASHDARPAERARFRGVRKVDTPLAGESFPRQTGGILNQDNFAAPAPRRWDDQAFENRLKHALSSGAHTPRATPAAKGASRMR